MYWIISALATCMLFVTPSYAHAYIGPGLGLGAIGVLLGIIMALFLAFVGLLWYPIKRLIGKKPTEIGQEVDPHQK